MKQFLVNCGKALLKVLMLGGQLLLSTAVTIFLVWAFVGCVQDYAARRDRVCPMVVKEITIVSLVQEQHGATYTYYLGTAERVYETDLGNYARVQVGQTVTATFNACTPGRVLNVVVER